MIGIFINPGVLRPLKPNHMGRNNSSFEYDAVSDRYARFLIDGIIPEVGKRYNLSANPYDRGVAGSSSGGTASFAAAWFRPDQFRRVITLTGNYANLRSGNEFANIIRIMEPKPLRVFLQDERRDQGVYGGGRFNGNQDLHDALKYSGYETTFRNWHGEAQQHARCGHPA
jgi:gluconolactonase